MFIVGFNKLYLPSLHLVTEEGQSGVWARKWACALSCCVNSDGWYWPSPHNVLPALYTLSSLNAPNTWGWGTLTGAFYRERKLT